MLPIQAVEARPTFSFGFLSGQFRSKLALFLTSSFVGWLFLRPRLILYYIPGPFRGRRSAQFHDFTTLLDPIIYFHLKSLCSSLVFDHRS